MFMGLLFKSNEHSVPRSRDNADWHEGKQTGAAIGALKMQGIENTKECIIFAGDGQCKELFT